MQISFMENFPLSFTIGATISEFDPFETLPMQGRQMKSWIVTLALASAAVGAMAQTPPAPVPARPRLTLTTDAFEDGGIIPNEFTMAAEGTPVSPKLTWTYVPDGKVSFALILHDPIPLS
jgi:hypothetical protein